MPLVTPTLVPLFSGDLPDPSDRATYGARGRLFWEYEAETMVPGMNDLATVTHGNAEHAAQMATVAADLANHKGDWSALTGALARPASCSHLGFKYSLEVDVADVTAHEPGVSAAWLLVTVSSDQITHGAGSVEDKLVEIDAWRSATDSELDLVAATKSFRNRLVNGDFTVNQLVKSGTVTLSAGQYGHDGWKGGASGCTYTFASSGGITTLTITAGSLINVVEGAFLQTGTHTLSWTGTAQGKIGAGSYSASGVTGAATAGTNLSIEFNTGTLALVQFEPGSIATPFEHRDDQLQRCQRYCWKTYAQGTAPGTATQDGARGCSNTVTIAYGAVMTLVYPVEMQASPTVTFYNPITGASGTWRAASADYAMGFASVVRGTNGALIGNSAAIPTAGLTLFGHALVEARL